MVALGATTTLGSINGGGPAQRWLGKAKGRKRIVRRRFNFLVSFLEDEEYLDSKEKNEEYLFSGLGLQFGFEDSLKWI